MQERSVRFWFGVLDIDNDGVISRNDIRQHVAGHSVPQESRYFCSNACLIWTELCDLCGVQTSHCISFLQFKESKAGPYCFDTIIRNQELSLSTDSIVFSICFTHNRSRETALARKIDPTTEIPFISGTLLWSPSILKSNYPTC